MKNFCEECGAKLDSNLNYCPKCGKTINRDIKNNPQSKNRESY